MAKRIKKKKSKKKLSFLESKLQKDVKLCVPSSLIRKCYEDRFRDAMKSKCWLPEHYTCCECGKNYAELAVTTDEGYLCLICASEKEEFEKELTKNVFENPTIQEWQLRDLTEPLDDPAELLRDIVKAIIMDIDENILVMDESSDYKNYEIKEEDLSFDSYITKHYRANATIPTPPKIIRDMFPKLVRSGIYGVHAFDIVNKDPMEIAMKITDTESSLQVLKYYNWDKIFKEAFPQFKNKTHLYSYIFALIAPYLFYSAIANQIGQLPDFSSIDMLILGGEWSGESININQEMYKDFIYLNTDKPLDDSTRGVFSRFWMYKQKMVKPYAPITKAHIAYTLFNTGWDIKTMWGQDVVKHSFLYKHFDRLYNKNEGRLISDNEQQPDIEMWWKLFIEDEDVHPKIRMGALDGNQVGKIPRDTRFVVTENGDQRLCKEKKGMTLTEDEDNFHNWETGENNCNPYDNIIWNDYLLKLFPTAPEPIEMDSNEFRKWSQKLNLSSATGFIEWRMTAEGKKNFPRKNNPYTNEFGKPLYCPISKEVTVQNYLELLQDKYVDAYKGDNKRGKKSFWGWLFNFEDKARTREDLLEFLDWVEANIDMIKTMKQGELVGILHKAGVLQVGDEMWEKVKKAIINLTVGNLWELKNEIAEFRFGSQATPPKVERQKQEKTEREQRVTDPNNRKKLLLEQESFNINNIFSNSSSLTPPKDPVLFNTWVEMIVRSLWEQVMIDDKNLAKVKEIIKYSALNEVQSEVRMRFLEEFEEVDEVTDDIRNESGMNHKINQKYGMWLIKNQHVLFCMDRTGSGKTFMGLSAAIEQKSKLCLVICTKTIIPHWMKEIQKVIPTAKVTSGFDLDKNENPLHDRDEPMHFHLINYDKFSQKDKENGLSNTQKFLKELEKRGWIGKKAIQGSINKSKKKRMDFVILDEVHNIKYNEDYTELSDVTKGIADASQTRIHIQELIEKLRGKNKSDWRKFIKHKKDKMRPPFNLVMLSATPVINSLAEAKDLLKLLTGKDYPALSVHATPMNAYLLHNEYSVFSMRSRKNFNVKVTGLSAEEAETFEVNPRLEIDEINELDFLSAEQICTDARLERIVELCKTQKEQSSEQKKSIVFLSTFVGGKGEETAIADKIKNALEKSGMTAGFFIGENAQRGWDRTVAKGGLIDYSKKNKDGSYFNPFVQGDLDVLICSKSVAEGYDGLQKVCNNLIFNGIPWTWAEVEQITGRLDREGQKEKEMHVHLLFCKIDGYEYDKKVKWDRITMKSQFQNCVVDGVIPTLENNKTKLEGFSEMKQYLTNKRRQSTKQQELKL